jgi:t-SNARE complex subunit (syntaxin)
MAIPADPPPQSSTPLQARMKAKANFYKLKKAKFDPEADVKQFSEECHERTQHTAQAVFEDIGARQTKAQAQINDAIEDLKQAKPLEHTLDYIEKLQKQFMQMRARATEAQQECTACQEDFQDISQNNTLLKHQLLELQVALKQPTSRSRWEKQLEKFGQEVTDKMANIK